MGDLVTLCGEPGFLRSTTPEPGPNVCPKCRALIEGMAAALKRFPVKAQSSAGRSIASTPATGRTSTCRTLGRMPVRR